MKSANRAGLALWAPCQLWPLILVTMLSCAGALEPEDTWETGSGHMTEELNVLESLTLHSANLVNVSFGAEDSCQSLDMGQYSTLSMSTRAAFGESFANELSLLVMLRSSLKEDTSLFSILNLHGDITFQIRINPNAFIFISKRRGLFEFPLPFLTDNKWHRVALSIAAKGVSLYVDCKRVETLPWSNYFGLGVSTDGILMLGGVIGPFDVPFKGSLQKLVFMMGDPGAAKRFCVDYNQTCLSSFPAEPLLNLSRSERGRRLDPASKVIDEVGSSFSYRGRCGVGAAALYSG